VVDLKAGDRLENWEILSAVGEGGMGAVYRARNILLGDVFAAVKVTHPKNYENARERFAREIKALLRLNHTAVVRVQGFGEDRERGLLWFAMDMVEGHALDAWVEGGRAFPVDLTLRMFSLLAEGLAHAHERGVAHRDLKPSNVLIRSDGAPIMVDFGISATEGEARLTRTGAVIGTPQYLPPEALDGRIEEPMKADLYAFGQMMMEVLNGEPAFPLDPQLTSTQNALRVMHQKVQRPHLDPGDGFPDGLRALIRDLTLDDPAQRFPSAHLLVERLLELQRTGGRAPTPIPGMERPAKADATWSADSAPTAENTAPEIHLERGQQSSGARTPPTFLVEDVAASTPEAVVSSPDRARRRSGLAWMFGASIAVVGVLGGLLVLVLVLVVVVALYGGASTGPERVAVETPERADGGDAALPASSPIQSEPVAQPEPEVSPPAPDVPAVGLASRSTDAPVSLAEPRPTAGSTDPPSAVLPAGEAPPVARPEPSPPAAPAPTAPSAPAPATPVPVAPAAPPAASDPPVDRVVEAPRLTRFQPDWSRVVGVQKAMSETAVDNVLGSGETLFSGQFCKQGQSVRRYLNGGVEVCRNLLSSPKRVVLHASAKRDLASRGEPLAQVLGATPEDVEQLIGAPQTRTGGTWYYNHRFVEIEFSAGRVVRIRVDL
jgi:serine/threonine protein kinase